MTYLKIKGKEITELAIQHTLAETTMGPQLKLLKDYVDSKCMNTKIADLCHYLVKRLSMSTYIRIFNSSICYGSVRRILRFIKFDQLPNRITICFGNRAGFIEREYKGVSYLEPKYTEEFLIHNLVVNLRCFSPMGQLLLKDGTRVEFLDNI